MGVHDHVREMKHTERTLVFPSPPVQKLTGECFSTTISGFVWVNDWLKVKVCLEYHPNDPRDHCAQSLQSFSSLRTADAFPVVASLSLTTGNKSAVGRLLKWEVAAVSSLRVLYFNRKFFC